MSSEDCKVDENQFTQFKAKKKLIFIRVVTPPPRTLVPVARENPQKVRSNAFSR
ncbi:hypothetical protein [Burkholderia pseudomultivorans]|uniref:hypothetical protein n=1 Tax=Burkholderia pseudomultivorans TaxID=1207504 RepID=UPI0012DAA589|nr:hypothetical protein [Burkholderia pseudomultivorans]